MARLYADENFSNLVVNLLRSLGHDVLTVKEAGNANHRIPDEEVLAFASRNNRAVLTFNRPDFIKLNCISCSPTMQGLLFARKTSIEKDWLCELIRRFLR